MLDHYFLQTLDRRSHSSSWLGAAIERYVTVARPTMATRPAAYTTACRCSCGSPRSRAHAGTARRRWGTTWTGSSSSSWRAAGRRSRAATARLQYIRDIRQSDSALPAHQSASASAPPTTAARPLAQWAPHFFVHLQEERGLSPDDRRRLCRAAPIIRTLHHGPMPRRPSRHHAHRARPIPRRRGARTCLRARSSSRAPSFAPFCVISIERGSPHGISARSSKDHARTACQRLRDQSRRTTSIAR